MRKDPPFQTTPVIIKLTNDISHELGVLRGAQLTRVPIKLRRENKIRTIHASLAIEGNSLTLEQVTAIINGKRVIGNWKDIQEVNNANEVYRDLSAWKATSIQSLKKAHQVLMHELTTDNGEWRAGGVGILKGKEVVHIAPPARMVPGLMEQLFNFVEVNKDNSWLIKACVFHYELEFIHPFSDGNGRIGRLWQQLLLMNENPIFEFISVETIIKRNQQAYYKVLAECDKAGQSTSFIEFSLRQILVSLAQHTKQALG